MTKEDDLQSQMVRGLRLKRRLCASLSALAVAMPSAALSQVDTIVVTAQKREESAQTVPLTISAFSEDKLERVGFDSFADLATLTPSLQFGNFGPITYVNIRGIGNENSTAGGDPGVALHFDGVYVGRPIGALFTAFDSERVEILKGPQGTLYGRNATGGSINYITRKPGDEFGGQADFTIGNYGRIRARGAVNIPFNDNVRGRFVGFIEDRDGFTENPFPDREAANDRETWGLRSHLDFDVGPASLLLSGTYISAEGVGANGELREPFPGTTTTPVSSFGGPPGFAFSPGGPASGVPAFNTYVDGNGNVVLNDLTPFSEARDVIERQDNEFFLVSATFEYDFGPVLFRSITGYVESVFLADQDGDHSILPLARLLLTEDSNQFSQEVQLVSNNESRFNWILGGFYFNEDAERRSRFFGSRYDVFADIFNVESSFNVGGVVNTEAWAFFGQGTYALTDTVNVTGGVRYSNDTKSGVNSGQQFPAGYSVEVGDSFDDVTYRVAVDWTPVDNILLFGSFSTGYKSGGINQVVNATADPDLAIFDPETVRAIEVGVKSTLFDGRAQVNATLFRNKYDDQQFQVFGPAGPEAFNAEGSTVQGFELEVQGSLADWLGFDGSFGYTDSEFDEQIVGGVDITGNRVQRTPEFTVSLGVTTEHDLGSLGSISSRFDYSYTDEIFYTALNRNAGFDEPGGSDLADSYNNVNIRLFWLSPDDTYTVEFGVTNVFNSVQEGNVFRGIGFLDIPGGGGPEEITYNPPRQFVGRVGVRF